LGDHAIVIGGSVGGLMAARALSDHFDRVTILERDPVQDRPEPRKGQPQARFLHGLLYRGKATMDRFYPGMFDEVCANGGIVGDMTDSIRWHINGGYRKMFKSNMEGVFMSRAMLEWVVRRRTLAIPNITLLDQTAANGLTWSEDKSTVTGVNITRRALDMTEDLAADLVLDVSGRGTSAPKWLEAAGYGRPPESVVKMDVTYSLRIYKRGPNDIPGARALIIGPEPGKVNLSVFMFPVEGDLWYIGYGSHGGAPVPTKAEEYLPFADKLAAPDLAQILPYLEPVSEVANYHVPSNLRRNYEKMSRFPGRYLVLGDAVCSFNPVYGQGMSTAAAEAEALGDLLAEHGTLDGLAAPWFREVGRVLTVPWQLTVGEDFRFPTTQGAKPPMQDALNRYVDRVNVATHSDAVVGKAFFEVMNLLKPPSSLMDPRIAWRVFFGRGQPYHPQPVERAVETSPA
jgi:2-polyprenyl-6-methoxyphenol hydroxylase-like FAD-dependent oxidoreductase